MEKNIYIGTDKLRRVVLSKMKPYAAVSYLAADCGLLPKHQITAASFLPCGAASSADRVDG